MSFQSLTTPLPSMRMVGEPGTVYDFEIVPQPSERLCSPKPSGSIGGALHVDGVGCTLLISPEVKMEIPVYKNLGGRSTMADAAKAVETVEQLLRRRHIVKTYEERCQYALDLVDMHLHEENPDHIDECIKLYSDDAVWEAPARGVAYAGRERIKEMYLRIFSSVDSISFHPVERFATPDRVFDDMWVKLHLTGPGFENCPLPIGTKIKVRLLHNFHIQDGLIVREIGYEIWLRDE